MLHNVSGSPSQICHHKNNLYHTSDGKRIGCSLCNQWLDYQDGYDLARYEKLNEEEVIKFLKEQPQATIDRILNQFDKDKQNLLLVYDAFAEAAAETMAIMGYNVIAENGFVVKKYADGRQEIIKEIGKPEN